MKLQNLMRALLFCYNLPEEQEVLSSIFLNYNVELTQICIEQSSRQLIQS